VARGAVRVGRRQPGARNPERARALYADAIRPAVSHAPPLFNLADSASLLWRRQVYGETPPLASEWAEVAEHARRFFPRGGMHFADIHAILAEAACRDDPGARQRIAQAKELAASGRLAQGPIVPSLCAGTAAFARGDYAEAADELGLALPELARVPSASCSRTPSSPPRCTPDITTR
jgi:hypothetical protein